MRYRQHGETRIHQYNFSELSSSSEFIALPRPVEKNHTTFPGGSGTMWRGNLLEREMMGRFTMSKRSVVANGHFDHHNIPRA